LTIDGATDATVFRAYGAHVLCPTLVPGDIEPCWSKLKTRLRTAQARTRDALDAAIHRYWQRSHRLTHAAGSVIAIMPYVSSKTALTCPLGSQRCAGNLLPPLKSLPYFLAVDWGRGQVMSGTDVEAIGP
jgi:hypothetical protein